MCICRETFKSSRRGELAMKPSEVWQAQSARGLDPERQVVSFAKCRAGARYRVHRMAKALTAHAVTATTPLQSLPVPAQAVPTRAVGLRRVR